ncbi:MAG: hypothetical protein RIS36_315 [Pseudomonadota bacterium]|jgi:hypothetical protein
MPHDIEPHQDRGDAHKSDPSHQHDSVEALLGLKAFEEHGVERSHLAPLTEEVLHRFLEVDTFSIPHNHVSRSDHEKEKGAHSHRREM